MFPRSYCSLVFRVGGSLKSSFDILRACTKPGLTTVPRHKGLTVTFLTDDPRHIFIILYVFSMALPGRRFGKKKAENRIQGSRRLIFPQGLRRFVLFKSCAHDTQSQQGLARSWTTWVKPSWQMDCKWIANGLLVYVGSCWFKHWVSPRLPLFTCFIRSDSPRGEGLNNSPWKMLRRTRRWMCSSEKHPWAFEWLINKRHLRWTSCTAIPCICREQSKSGFDICLRLDVFHCFSKMFLDHYARLRKDHNFPLYPLVISFHHLQVANINDKGCVVEDKLDVRPGWILKASRCNG